ncbi:MAG: PorT family protein [Chitinophagaceae bacterium]|nr:PorT family protein [Chitinophagaceae bacterium]
MFDNDKFETQVQQKLQEMDLRPSASVWNRIESQLPSERRRRGAILLWAALVALICTTGGYFFFFTKTASDKATTSTLAAHSETVPTKNKKSASGSSSSSNSSSASDQKNQLKLQPQASTLPAVLGNEQKMDKTSGSNKAGYRGADYKAAEVSTQGSTSGDQTLGSSGEPDRPVVSAKKNGKNNKRPQLTSANKGNDYTTPDAPAIFARDNETEASSAVLVDDMQTPEEAKVPLASQVSGIASMRSKIEIDAAIKEDLEPSAVLSTKLRVKKWTLHLVASGGQSIYSNGKVNKLFTAAEPVVLNNSTPSFLSAGGAFTAPSIAPSDIKPGNSFSIGLNARYRLSRRLLIAGGVQYSLLTTEIKTGRRMENPTGVIDANGRFQTLNESFATGSAYDHTNRFNFIELPVLLYYQLNKGKKLPIYVNGGLSYSRLINTNTLHYDGRSKIYYKNNQLVRTNFLNVEGGVSAQLSLGKNFSFLIGPKIQYGITNLFTARVPDNNKHALFIGIKTEIPLMIF